jgi:glycosidase
MAAYVASIYLHGGALIYGSQEVGYPDRINFFKYVPVDWTANSQLYEEYEDLIELYNEHPALRKGQLSTWPDNDVLIYEKSTDEERFLVLVNVRNREVEVKIPASWVGKQVDDVAPHADLHELGETLSLAPYQYRIIERDE